MKKNTKALAKLMGLVLVVALTAALFAACSGAGGGAASSGAAPAAEAGEETASAPAEESTGGSGGGAVQVGIVLPTKDEPRWIQDQTRFEAILDDAGFTYQVLFSQGSSATEKTNVETLVSQGCEVLIICPQDTAAVGSTVEMAQQAGVTVVGYDRLITGTEGVGA